MSQIVSELSQSQTREFRTVTASTKVTDIELAELEQAAASRGVRLGEWVRDVLLREARSSDRALEPDPLMTEIVALQMFLTNVLSFVACGERMSPDQYQELMRSVKASKRRTAREIVTQYAAERKEEGHA